MEWAHAIAPKANILLVEANDGSWANLNAAVDYARHVPGVVAVSMSYGAAEFSTEKNYDSYYTTPSGRGGVTFVASTGDTGAPTQYPSVSANVVGVGGPALFNSTVNYTLETGWPGSSGGISAYVNQPAYQNGVVTQSTTRRTTPDVAYDAYPSSGVPVYDTFDNPSTAPWRQWGGTSIGAPQWAALIAIADQGRALAGKGALEGATQTLPLLYSMPSTNYHDITSGTSKGTPNYTAGPGFDLVTGRGSPYADRVVNHLAFGQQPTNASLGQTISPAVTVRVLDAYNNVITSDNSDQLTLAVGSNPAGGVLSGSTTATVSGGVATFNNLSLNQVGAGYTLVAGTGVLNPITSASFDVTAVAVSTALEGFESGNLSAYKTVGGTTASASVATAAMHNGTYGLVDKAGADWIYRNDPASQVARGDTISVWLQFPTGADGLAYFGFGATSTGTLSLVASAAGKQLLLQNNAAYGGAAIASVTQTWLANHWYRLEVSWGTSGSIVGRVFDTDGATLLQSVTGSDTTIASGGIAFRATGWYSKSWDTVTVTHAAPANAAAIQSGLAAHDLALLSRPAQASQARGEA